MPKDIYISASLLKDYLKCPMMVTYRLEHSEDYIETPQMIVGNIAHFTLQTYWNDRVRAVGYVESQIENTRLSPKYADKVRLCVDNYFVHFSNLTTEDDLIEYRFKIPFGNAYLVGKIDRITNSGCIIDWKTSLVHTDNIAKDPQFILYKYVYQQLFEKDPAAVLRINLADHTVDSYSSDINVEFHLINGIIPTVIKAIQNEDLSPIGLLTGKCSRCQYLHTCHKGLGY